MLKQFLTWFPQLLLFSLIFYDIFKLTHAKGPRFKLDAHSLLMMVVFVGFYIFLVDTGIAMTYELFTNNLTALTGQVAGLFLLPIGYVLTKEIFYIQYGDDLDDKSKIHDVMFLHYFVFSSGAVVAFTAAFFILFQLQKII